METKTISHSERMYVVSVTGYTVRTTKEEVLKVAEEFVKSLTNKEVKAVASLYGCYDRVWQYKVTVTVQ